MDDIQKRIIDSITFYINHKNERFLKKSFTKKELVDFVVYCNKPHLTTNEKVTEAIHLCENALQLYIEEGFVETRGEKFKANKYIEKDFYFIVEALKQGQIEEQQLKQPSKLEYIGLEDLKKFDYKRFGTILKQKQLLPPSYDRKPESVEVYVNNASEPMVAVTFKSTTSDSYRVFKITPSDIYEYVNGSNEGRIYRDKERYEEIRDAWKSFKNSSMWDLNYKENRMIDYKVREMEREAEKIGAMKLIKDVETDFINKHYNSKFTEFYDSWGVPHFSLPRIVEGKPSGYEMVTPMTPKTLELCVLRLEKDAKLEEADNLEYFKDKCEQLAEHSVYPGDWTETTERLADYLVKFKIASQVNIEEEK